MRILYWVSLYILDFIKLYLIIVKIMGYEHKKNNKIFVGGLIGTSGIIPIIMRVGLEDMVVYIVGIIAMIVMTACLKYYKDIFIVLLSYLIICVVDPILASLWALLLGYNIHSILDSYILSFISNFLSIIIFIILYKIKQVWKIGNLIISKSQIGIIFFGILGIALYIVPVQVLGLMQKSERVRLFTVLGINLSGIAFIIICIYLVVLNANNKYYQECLRINEKLLEQQKDYYAVVIEKDRDTKKFRHDITSHVYCMKILFECEKYDELYSYINDIQGAIEKLSSDIQTGNDIVNVIAGDVLRHKTHNDIELKWRGRLPDKLKISNMDLCVIFSNLLRNSVEAVEKISENIEKKIEVDVKQLENNIMIRIKNPISEKINMIDSRLVTSKLDKNNHGFGSLNAKEAVNRYGGNISYKVSEESFLVEIIFNDIIMH